MKDKRNMIRTYDIRNERGGLNQKKKKKKKKGGNPR